MIEMMRDPLGHIVRNALDHGIETHDERRAAGKRENGRLTVSARQSRNQIIIQFLYDGRGIHTDKLVRRLVETSARTQRQLHDLTAPIGATSGRERRFENEETTVFAGF